jgi:hypothetical protein
MFNGFAVHALQLVALTSVSLALLPRTQVLLRSSMMKPARA